MRLEAGPASLVVEPSAGGRISSLLVDGLELLVGREDDPMAWGCYPMVPFAGRVRNGSFAFDGTAHQLPVNLDPHAIHGYGFVGQWQEDSERSIRIDLGEPWPFPGQVEQHFELLESQLTVSMTLRAEARQPATMGWHPWFRRDIGVGEPLRLEFSAAHMYELDDLSIPTGRLIDPPAGPWDNCFTDLTAGPVLRWGDRMVVEVASSADHWVIFDEPVHALCVEPQTGPPDAFNGSPPVVEAGSSAAVEMTLTWG